MTQFVRGANPIWFMVDLTGLPLNDMYYAFFLTNDLPYVPTPVYQDPNGLVQWSNPLEFQPSGTLPNNLYFDETQTYRIEIRQGPTSSDPLIWLIENYTVSGMANPSSDPIISADNIITNPQFADIYFESPLTYTQGSSGTYTVNIGPGWQLVLQGTGTTVLTQILIDGNSDIFTNPTYALQINNSGWTSAQLIQNLSNNGAIFSGGAISCWFLGEATSSAQNISVEYEPSVGAATNILPSTQITVGSLNPYMNAVNLPLSTNTDTGKNANVNLVFNLPGTSNLTFSNVMVVGQSVNLSTNFMNPAQVPSYQEIPYERIVDQEFHVYKPELSFKPIPSYLIGWDFPLNPAQLFGDTVSAQAVGTNKSYYAWDQTILFQSANSGITVARSNGGLQLTANNTTQMAVIQYLTENQIREILQNILSVNLSAFSTTASNNGIIVTISLWYTTSGSLPSTIGSNNSLVATLNASGKPATFNGSWTEIPPLNGQEASFVIGNPVNSNSNFNQYPFNGWWNLNNISQSNAANYFAIVIGTASITAADSLTINSCSLQLGNIATPPAPKGTDEVLKECQYYYEKSYIPTTAPGTATYQGGTLLPVGLQNNSTNSFLDRRSFTLTYRSPKISAIVPTFYSPATGASGNVFYTINRISVGSAASTDSAISGWTALSQTRHNYSLQATTSQVITASGFLSNDEGYLAYQYVADARLGQ